MNTVELKRTIEEALGTTIELTKLGTTELPYGHQASRAVPRMLMHTFRAHGGGRRHWAYGDPVHIYAVVDGTIVSGCMTRWMPNLRHYPDGLNKVEATVARAIKEHGFTDETEWQVVRHYERKTPAQREFEAGQSDTGNWTYTDGSCSLADRWMAPATVTVDGTVLNAPAHPEWRIIRRAANGTVYAKHVETDLSAVVTGDLEVVGTTFSEYKDQVALSA